MYRSLAETIKLFSVAIANSNRPEDKKLGSDYLLALAPLLAEDVLDEPILTRFIDVESLLKNTWVVEQDLFEDAFSKWAEFSDVYLCAVLSDMSLAERLSVLSLEDEFAAVKASQDEEKMRSILRRIKLDESEINRIIHEG